MLRNGLGLADLVSLEDWKKTQGSFSEALDITLRTVTLDGKVLVETGRPNRLCKEILPKTPHGKICIDLDCIIKEHVLASKGIEKETQLTCPLRVGLDLFVVPVTAFGNKVVAYIILGPVILKSRKTAAEYAKDAEKLGVKAEDMIDALIEVNVFSHNKIYYIVNLVRDIFSYMAQTGYHKKRLGEIAPEVVAMDPLFARYYEEKILNALLNACTLALDADSGSVMTLDKKTKMLHIKVASKMDKDIMKNTNIKMGEGIAGLAAATAKPIILPKDEKKSGLSGKLKRNYIKSSMIVPINKNNSPDVYGVINLNMVRKSVDFTEKDIAIVKELVNMASIALMPLQQKGLEDT